MDYQTFLTVLPVNEDINNLKPAIELVKDLDAHLDIIIVGELLSPSDYFYGGIADDSWRLHNAEIYKSSEQLVEDVEGLVKKHHLSANVVAERQFQPMTGEILCRYALCADLNLLNKKSLLTNSDTMRSFYRALIDSGRPSIILTDNPANIRSPETIMIAWDGKPEAAAAIHQSLPILKAAKNVDVVMIDPEALNMGENPGNDVAVFLARHDVNVIVKPMTKTKDTIAETLMQHATDSDANLIIMGAFGTHRLREWLMGGITQQILEGTDRPVFLTHR